MIPRTLRAALSCALLAVSAPGLAQARFDLEPDFAETDEAAPPVYAVEVLIFAYNDFNPSEEEFAPEPPRWPKRLARTTIRATPHTLQPSSADWLLESLTLPTDPPTDASAEAASAAAGSSPATPAADDADEFGNTFAAPRAGADDAPWYTLLPRSQFRLAGQARRLGNLDAYTPLVHTAWSQEALLEEDAQAFDLATLGILRPSGTIRLHRSRFLHLTLDLVLQDEYRYRLARPAREDDPPLAELIAPLRYRIDVQRRVRSDEVHFFDHPAFGVLVMIRPQPADPEATSEAAAGPAA